MDYFNTKTINELNIFVSANKYIGLYVERLKYKLRKTTTTTIEDIIIEYWRITAYKYLYNLMKRMADNELKLKKIF